MTEPIVPVPARPLPTSSITAAYYASFVALGLTLAALGPTLPGLAERTGSSLSAISYLFTARSLGYLLGSYRGGRLFDRMRGHPVAAAALLSMALAMALVPLMPSLWLLIAAMLVLGAAEGTMDVGLNTLLVWIHRANLGPYMNALHFFFGVGAFVSPLVVAQVLARSESIDAAYWILAVALVPVAVWLARLPSPPIESAETTAEAGSSKGLVVVLAACFFFCVGAEVAFGGWIYTYALTLGLADVTGAAYLTSAFWGSFTVGRLIAIPISARIGPVRILAFVLVGCVLSIVLILSWPHSLTVLWLGTLGIGMSVAPIFASLLTLAERHLAITGRLTGWFFVGSSTGAMSLPWLIGQYFESVGPTVTMVIILANLIVALGLFAALILHVRSRVRPA